MSRTLVAALVCLGLAPPALAQEPVSDGPVATAPEATARPVSAPTAERLGAPTDDYGYVAWCYGAVSGYVDQYEKTMPEVIRIERAFPTPSTEENIAKVYPEQRDSAVKQLATFRDAMTAAEKASPRSLAAAAQQGLSRGRGIWSGSALVTKAQLAQFWMGWTPPAECDARAKTLIAKSALFGQALAGNAPPAPVEASAPVAEAPPAEPAPAAAEPPAPVAQAPSAEKASSIDSLLNAAASGQGASADAVLRGRK